MNRQNHIHSSEVGLFTYSSHLISLSLQFDSTTIMSLSNVSTPTHTPYIRANDPSLPSSEEGSLNLPGAPGPHAHDHLTNGEVDEGLGKAFGVDHPLFEDLAPEDSYDKNGTYWVRPHPFPSISSLTLRRIFHGRRDRHGSTRNLMPRQRGNSRR